MARDNPNVSRFYSLALGKYNNFKSNTAGLIAEADSSPDVSLHSLLYANNSSTIVIQDFDNGCEGQLIHLINVGSPLSFLKSAELLVKDSSNLAKNDNITFIHHNTSWYEASRRSSANLDILYSSELGADNQAPDVTNAKVLVINNSGATVLAGLSGGYVGQILTIVNVKSNVTLSHNALLLNADTGGVGFIITVSGAVSLININGSKWVANRYAFTP